MIGVKLDTCTFLHAVEEWCGVPVLSKEPVRRYIFNAGCRVMLDIYWHTGAHSENFPRAEELLLQAGALTRCRFGNAESLLMDSRKTLNTLEKVLQENSLFFAHNRI